MSQLASNVTDLTGGSLAGRHRKNRLMTWFLTVLMGGVVAILLWVLAYVALKGYSALNWKFLTDTPPGNPSDAGGGFANGIVGSVIIVGIATLLAIPVGIGAAIFLSEYGGGRFASLVRFLTDVTLGIPTIVVGAFVYAVWVLNFGFSGYAGALAMAIVMLPLIVRASEEMLRLVPNDLREASLAMGVTRARTTLSVVLPAATSGLITGVMLAVARAMGETAPLLLTTLGNDLYMERDPGHRMSTLSLQIFGSATAGFPDALARAWAGALTLVGMVLILYVAARLIGRRNIARA